MIDAATFNTLREFRARVYDRFDARRDALFELLDAATVAGLVPSLAYLSLPPVHRRRWGSLYDALAAGDMDAPALRELVARYPLDDGQPIYALDTSIWPRDDAETSPGRGYYHSSSRQSAGQPIVTGWSYAWLAQLSFTHDSWTAPLDVQRVPAGGNAHAVAAAQIWELCGAPARGWASARCASSTPAMIPRPSLANWRNWMGSGSPFWCDCAATAASMPIRRQRTGAHGRTTTTARPEVRLRRRAHLVGTDERAPRAARAVWLGPRAHLGRRAHQDAQSSSQRQLPPESRRARHSGAGGGRALAAPDAHPQAPVAVVARTGRNPTWPCCGERTYIALIWSTPTASASRRSTGPRHACAPPLSLAR